MSRGVDFRLHFEHRSAFLAGLVCSGNGCFSEQDLFAEHGPCSSTFKNLPVLNGKNKEHKSKDSLSKEKTVVFLCHTLLPSVLSRPEGLVLVFSARPSRGERVP